MTENYIKIRIIFQDLNTKFYMRKKLQLYNYVKIKINGYRTRGQSNLTKSASRGAHSPVRDHPRGSKVVPLNSWVGFPISVP